MRLTTEYNCSYSVITAMQLGGGRGKKDDDDKEEKKGALRESRVRTFAARSSDPKFQLHVDCAYSV